MDRVKQVNYLRELAEDILLSDMGEENSAESLVAFYESEGSDYPDWFDAHDRALLVEYVDQVRSEGSRIAKQEMLKFYDCR